ncbi:hypothetical protein G5I_03391 [Acromyrmex echinatior]|uniref:Uncharacterized protein n=1 Tax=Acromyrmex echinatior TaxID=103372 RepID=F4WCV8_ACREC|nr:hypothetical protein G5I_03391 [Acromyrmex echinatior]
MGETCRTECRAECRTLYREKKRTEEVISEVRREQSGAMNNGGWKPNERNESKRKRTRQAGPSMKPPPLHSSMPFIFRSRRKFFDRKRNAEEQTRSEEDEDAARDTEVRDFKAIARKSSCNRKTIKSDELIGYCVEAKHCRILCAEVIRVKRHNLKAMIIDTSFRSVERLQLTPYPYD